MEFYSTIKRTKYFHFHWGKHQMDLDGIMLIEISQAHKEKYMISLIIRIQKTKQMNKQNKTETESYLQKANRWLPEGCGTGGCQREVGKCIREIGEGD